MNVEIKIAGMLAILLYSGAALAVPITIDDADAGAANGTNVGMIDNIVAATNDLDNPAPGCGQTGNSSDPVYEECWVENVLGVDVDFTGKKEGVERFETTADNVIAFALQYGPGYYIIKNSVAWVLMENLFSIDWGVLSLTELAEFTGESSFGNIRQTIVISHVSEINGGGDHDVAEPGTLGLLGLGLLGLGIARRRRNNA